MEILRLRVAELEEAIRRLAEQDATLSLLCKRDGSQVVTVTMDGTLTDAEREAVEWAAEAFRQRWKDGTGLGNVGATSCGDIAFTLRCLPERLK